MFKFNPLTGKLDMAGGGDAPIVLIVDIPSFQRFVSIKSDSDFSVPASSGISISKYNGVTSAELIGKVSVNIDGSVSIDSHAGLSIKGA